MSHKASSALSLTVPETVPLIRADLPTLDEVADEFREILTTGKISNFGKYLTRFEKCASEYLGAEVATVSSGTMGLILSLQALGVGRGKKVLLPSFSFMATAQAVLYAGATPVFAEIEDDMTLSVSDMSELLENDHDIVAVIPVHAFGRPARVNEIQQAVNETNKRQSRTIRIVYDAAHAFGAAFEGKRVGGFGNAEVFSLSVTKALVCVEGGLISSHDSVLIQRLKKMRNYGIDSNYDAHYPGLNGKMSEFNAVIGYRNLQKIEQILTTREQKRVFYDKAIAARSGFEPMPIPKNIVHTYKDYTVTVPEKLLGKRDKVVEYLRENGIETRAYFYPPIHEQRFFKKYQTRPLPKTETLSRKVITLPFFTAITNAQMERVATVLSEAEGAIR